MAPAVPQVRGQLVQTELLRLFELLGRRVQEDDISLLLLGDHCQRVDGAFLVGGELVDGEVVDLRGEGRTLEAMGSGLRRAESMT